MRVFTAMLEKPKNDKADIKISGHYGLVVGLISYLVLAFTLGIALSLALSFAFMTFLRAEDTVIAVYILHAIAAACPFVVIGWLVLRDQKRLQGALEQGLVIFIGVVTLSAIVVMGGGFFEAILSINSLPVGLRHVVSEYDDYSSSVGLLWFTSVSLSFFLGLGIVCGGAFFKREAEKLKNDTL